MAAFSLTVDQPVFLGFSEFDQSGNPMAPPVAGAATWSNSTPGTGALTPSSTGQSATYNPTAAGSDVVTLTLVAGGQTFTATASITVAAVVPPPQVLSSVQITQIPALV